jgi:thiol-disulfide isomerase/thioredoxin/Tfp pilus assembly protein PilF
MFFRMNIKYLLTFAFLLSSLLAGLLAGGALAQSAPPRPAEVPQVDSDAELQRAIQSASGGEAQLVEGLEAYLGKYPQSRRRAEIEREIFRLSLKTRDRARTLSYGERMLNGTARDAETLTTLIRVLRERRGEGDLAKALEYADRLVERIEASLSAGKPGRLSQAQWNDRKERSRASVYLLRGQVRADLGDEAKASDDLRRSLKAEPLAEAALALAALAERRQASDEAFQHYLRALVISFDTGEEIDRMEVRRKLSQLYAAKTGSEKGLGDQLLKAWDEHARARAERLAKLTIPNINEGVTDPLLFKLTRLDGSTIKLADYRGKVVVLNFWATWCGPCRIEMPLFEQAMLKYKDDPRVVFLAVNTDEDRQLVEPYLKERKVKLPVVYAEYLDEHYAIAAIPTTLILNGDGRISFRQQGFNSREDFVGLLTEKIEEARRPAPSDGKSGR